MKTFALFFLPVIVGVYAVGLLPGIWWSGVPAYASPLRQEFSLMHYDGHLLQFQWIEGGAFAQALEQDVKMARLNPVAGRKPFLIENSVLSLKKKFKVAFSPKVFIQPFIAVQKLQDILAMYQFKKRGEQMPIDENFQAKAFDLPANLPQLKRMTQQRLFSVSPYYNRVYGIHLQINW